MKYWLKTNLPQLDKCLKKRKESARQKPIKLVDFTGAFFIFGIGVVLAIGALLIEMVCFNFYKKEVRKY